MMAATDAAHRTGGIGQGWACLPVAVGAVVTVVAVLAVLAVIAVIGAGQAHAADASVPAADARRSGADFMSASTQAMQRDDSLNPGMLWVKDGEALWQAASEAPRGRDTTAIGRGGGVISNVAGGGAGSMTSSSATGSSAGAGSASATRQSCAGCHGDATRSMRGVAARYPAFDDDLKRPLTLAARINRCRQKNQQSQPWRAESAELLALESYVAFQSRAMPIAPPADARLQPYQERGRQRYLQRLGQLDLSCAQCHDQRAGLRLGSSPIPQAHPGGYPVYRLEWQGVGSLERRLRNCMSGVRAESFAYGSVELVELQAYLALRARGMPLEAPGVRP